ncbi:7-carboxy-7-deazaguanine synthase QueE [Coraliomargarita sinensis]|uniref:7-carboxy-7-deazaguanine synthase n=1 Tax=Coraliomargarita sinensis TaxID=2174842 RepID=A0A317ZL06_9BACT|nr:7-carboxy-7-deazaguanine synthase QueE [Coraliomargarita sinensis]PXA05712.1 7-carboxy-7-deazaguanine synthase QueE [Coraliomargarita sinensis]
MLPVHEQFYSFQGEGTHAGRAAYFIRTFGCPVHCPWCDSAGTWHPDYIPDRINRIAEEELAAAAAASKAEFVIVTGGEPSIHNLQPLVAALHQAGLKAHLETSGAFPIQGEFDWVTLSPKRWKLPLSENLSKADEFKIIVDSPGVIEEYTQPLNAKERPVWLHPEWSQRENGEVLNAITDWVKAHGAPYRAGWQMHKPYKADFLDPNSAQVAPLGGDPNKGY